MQASPDLDASSLTKWYTSMCAIATPIDNPNAPQLCQQQIADLYGRGLAAAAGFQRQSVKPETLKVGKFHTAVRELADWLQSKQLACNRGVDNAIPEDIPSYFTQHWLPNHDGSVTANGELIAAPGGISSTKSHLFSELELLGRIGDWNPATQTGNSTLNIQKHA